MILPADKTSADSEAGAWDNRRQREATEDKKLTKAQAGAEETRTNSYAGADADHAVDAAAASETAGLKINQAEATALAGEENALTTGAFPTRSQALPGNARARGSASSFSNRPSMPTVFTLFTRATTPATPTKRPSRPLGRHSPLRPLRLEWASQPTKPELGTIAASAKRPQTRS